MPQPPFIQEFGLPNGQRLTVVVMDGEEFDALVDRCCTLWPDREREISAVKQVQWTMLARGSKTQPILDQYHVSTDRAAFIVRGAGPAVYARLVGGLT